MAPREIGVVLRALRHLPDTYFVECGREIFLDEIFLQLLERRQNTGRDRILCGRGFRVMRFTNGQVDRLLPEVLRRIEELCREVG